MECGMRVVLKYGKDGLPFDIPPGIEATVIHKTKMPVIADGEAAVEYALSHPAGGETLARCAQGCRNACILICDITRPVPNGVILPVLIREMIRAGIPADAITVLIATGLHRPNQDDELREVVGDDRVLASVKVENHVAGNDADHVQLGLTPRGMPVKLDKRFVQAELRIVVGLIEPHFMAGYSGGRKVIIPGVAHRDTIGMLHATRLLMEEGVSSGRLEGNPLHEEQTAAVRMVGECLAVNAVIDEGRNCSFVNFGEIHESHRRAVALARPYFEVPLDRRFATIVTSAAGYPLDRNYYQTVKAMVGVEEIAEPGADIFVVSACHEGLGTEEYALSQAKLIDLGMEGFIRETSARECAAVDEWESVMQVKAMKKGRIHLFAKGLSARERALTGVTVIDSLQEAFEQCMSSKQDKSVAVIPEGPYVLPVYRPGA
jgi:nickel-dependent lactate racemase